MKGVIGKINLCFYYAAIFCCLELFFQYKYIWADDCQTIPFKTVIIDGHFDDWSRIDPIITDVVGDVYNNSYNDLVSVSVAHDNIYLYVKVELSNSLDGIQDVDISPHFSFRDSDGNLIYIAAFFPNSGPKDGWESVNLNNLSVMTYPSSFLRYSGKYIEFKALLKDIPFINDMKSITAWVLGPNGLTDNAEDVQVCGLDWPNSSDNKVANGYNASSVFELEPVTDCISIPFKRIKVDGNIDDWRNLPPMFTDLTNDVYQNSYIDFKKAYLANDGVYLYGRFEMNRPIISNSNFGANLIFKDDMNNEIILGAFFPHGSPYSGWEDITLNGVSVMTYPSDFLRYFRNNIEFKFLLKDIPSLEHLDRVGAWTIGEESLYDNSYDIPICGFLHESERKDITGWWYDSSKPGTGISLEFNDENRFFLAWYVYDQSGMPVWYTADGELINSTTFVGDLKQWTGWQWNESYSSPVFKNLGSVKGIISNTGTPVITLSWSGDNLGEGVLQLSNFLKEMVGGTTDARHLTGWWYDPAYIGMGFFIEVRAETLFMAWYNYGEGGVPRWWTSSGTFSASSNSYHGTLSAWQGGQVPGSNYKKPYAIDNQGTIDFVYLTPSRARLTINGETILNLQRFNF